MFFLSDRFLETRRRSKNVGCDIYLQRQRRSTIDEHRCSCWDEVKLPAALRSLVPRMSLLFCSCCLVPNSGYYSKTPSNKATFGLGLLYKISNRPTSHNFTYWDKCNQLLNAASISWSKVGWFKQSPMFLFIQCLPDLTNSVLTNHPDLTNQFLTSKFFYFIKNSDLTNIRV